MPALRRPRPNGFSLIELMIVLLIFAIILAIVIPNMMVAKYRAHLSACLDNQKSLANALELYKIEYKQYPSSLNPAFLTNFVNRPIVDCPTADGTNYTYIVDQAEHAFTLVCQAGVHHVILDTVQDDYPQYSHHLGRSILKP
jgi:prepilin-type N-terminal cleavage/methylation domain-containing protein